MVVTLVLVALPVKARYRLAPSGPTNGKLLGPTWAQHGWHLMGPLAGPLWVLVALPIEAQCGLPSMAHCGNTHWQLKGPLFCGYLGNMVIDYKK